MLSITGDPPGRHENKREYKNLIVFLIITYRLCDFCRLTKETNVSSRKKREKKIKRKQHVGLLFKIDKQAK